MAIPLVIAAGGLLTAIYAAIPDAAKDVTKQEFTRLAERAIVGDLDDFTNDRIAEAFEKLGLEIVPEEGLTPQAITRAINQGPLRDTGIELSNIFDKTACQRDLKRIALRYAAEAFGVKVTDTSAEGLRKAIKEAISKEIAEQIGDGSGTWLEAVPELVELARALAQGIANGVIDEAGAFIPPELMNDDFHVKLRERQAKYAAGHSRKWIPI